MLAQPPEVHTCAIVANKTSPPLRISSDPAIILANFEYKPGTLTHALGGWKDVVGYVRENEAATKGYTVCEDKEGNSVRTVEVYENWDFLESVHVKNEAIKRNQEQNGRDRTGVKGAVRVKAIDGFLGREERYKL